MKAMPEEGAINKDESEAAKQAGTQQREQAPSRPAAAPEPASAGTDGKNKAQGLLHHLRTTIQKLPKRSKLILAFAIIAVLAISITVTVLLNRVQYTALYSDLSADEAGEILGILQDDGVDAKMNGTNEILVPEGQADELRVKLASQGYPKSGLSYDMFTDSSSFGSTDVEVQMRLQYTLQENIRTTISNMDKIKDCIVIVNLGTSSAYVSSKNKTEASAAVMLELDPGETLSNSEALAIARFVMRSVPNLQLENVCIVDSSMNSYDLSDTDTQEDGTFSATQIQLSEQMKEILKKQTLNILEPALGSGNVAVSVNLALDFNKETQSSVQFSAPIEGETEGMLRSLEETLSKSDSASGTSKGSAGTDSNGVSGTEYLTTDGGGKDSAEDSSKVYNYELNKLQTQIEKAQGSITNLSVSIVLNSDAEGAAAAEGQVSALVANAIGVDQNYISVAMLPFVEPTDSGSFDDYYQQSQQSTQRAQMIEIIKMVLICLTALGIAVLALRFLRNRKLGEKLEQMQDPDMPQDHKQQKKKNTPSGEMEDEELLENLMQVKSDKTGKVEKLVEAYPEAAVQILRNWLSDN